MNDLSEIPAKKKELRRYQAEAIQRLRISLAGGIRRLVLVLPTGAGKTLVASHIAAGALSKGGLAVMTVPAKDLVNQTIAAFEAEGILHIGALQAAHARTDGTAPVQVASVQTLARRGPVAGATVVLVDECHIYSAAIKDWMAQRPDLVFIGLTATPGRAAMASEWQELVVGTTTRELIDMGHLSQFTVFAPTDPDLSGVAVEDGDFQAKAAAQMMTGGGLVGDILQNYILHGESRPTLGFAVNVAHGRRMADEFNAAGIAAAFVDANTDDAARLAIQEDFRRGRIQVIWSVRTMTTGIDLPVSGIIDAAPTRSAMLHQQKIGRGLRINPGTEDLVIWDHAGNTLRLGFVDDLVWSELPASGGPQPNARRGNTTPLRCTSCNAVARRGESGCRTCGGPLIAPADPLATGEGELSLLVREIAGRKASLAQKQNVYSQLIGLAREQGSKCGAAFYQYRDLFGTAPPSRLRRVAKSPTATVREYARARAAAYARLKREGNED